MVVGFSPLNIFCLKWVKSQAASYHYQKNFCLLLAANAWSFRMMIDPHCCFLIGFDPLLLKLWQTNLKQFSLWAFSESYCCYQADSLLTLSAFHCHSPSTSQIQQLADSCSSDRDPLSQFALLHSILAVSTLQILLRALSLEKTALRFQHLPLLILHATSCSPNEVLPFFQQWSDRPCVSSVRVPRSKQLSLPRRCLA